MPPLSTRTDPVPTVETSEASPDRGQTRPIIVRGGRVHNLREVDVELPRGKWVSFCGRSGSGKTSLAIDTLYAAGQRAYIESFSAYTRQYLQRLDKPDCDAIENLPAAIAVTRGGGVRTNRSTVGTTTEIAEHVRLWFSKVAELFCPQCGSAVGADDPGEIAATFAQEATDVRAMVGFEVWLPSRKEASEILSALQQDGYQRLLLGDQTFHLNEDDRKSLATKVGKRGIVAGVIVDRLSNRDELSRWTESLETALAEGGDRAVIWSDRPWHELQNAKASSEAPAAASATAAVDVDGRPMFVRKISRGFRCDQCDLEFHEPAPRLFNFNHPLGACPKCEGFGDVVDVDEALIVPDPSLSLAEGAIAPWNSPAYAHELEELLALAPEYGIPVDKPYKKLSKKHRQYVWRGVPEKRFGGLDGFFRWLDKKKYKMHVRVFAARYRSYRTCPQCNGKRLKDEVLAYRIDGQDIAMWMSLSADQWTERLETLQLDPRRDRLSRGVVEEILRRLRFLQQVGLGYLTPDRSLRTLSGGEVQRVSLTSTLGSSLVNMLYVLDEPTAGLHGRDVDRLCDSIATLRDRGNTVVTVEHNAELIHRCDHVIEFGPGAGQLGGEVTFAGSPKQLAADASTVTGPFLSGDRGTTMMAKSNVELRQPTGRIKLRGASGHNLKNIDVEFPLGVFCVVSGVSGSGKSSLIHETLFPSVASRVTDGRHVSLPIAGISGLGSVDDCLMVDQSPISRSARSAPVTYVKAFDPIRKVFAETIDAKTRNFSPGHFSFNSDKGQCRQCEGSGVLEIDMQFMADVTMECPSCKGRRFRDEVLDIRYRDRTIADVLEMTAVEAIGFFRGSDKVISRLQTMVDVGLDYIRLGQPATTLSSGEGQRLKLAAFLASASRRRTLFIMDEPTTGLHFADIVRLRDCFDALLNDGHSMVVVEHHPMMIASADHVIDIGPDAAGDGGRVVFEGSPIDLMENRNSHTAAFLRSWHAGMGSGSPVE